MVSNFQGAVASAPVVDEVGDQLGISRQEITGGLSTRQVAASNLVEVGYEGDDPDLAIQIVELQIEEALELKEDLGSPDARVLVAPTAAEPVSRLSQIGRGVITAIAVALALAIGLILLIRFLRSSA